MKQIKKHKSPSVYKLYREVNYRIRYYSFKIYKTLFGEYILEREYGSIKNKRPTGSEREYFNTLSEALIIYDKTIEAKLKRGYKSYI